MQTQFNACSVEALVSSTRGVQRKLEDLRGLLKAILTDVADKVRPIGRLFLSIRAHRFSYTAGSRDADLRKCGAGLQVAGDTSK